MPRKILWIESARTVAMLIVVIWHCIRAVAETGGTYATWSYIPAAILPCAVPMFFIVSGFFAHLSPSTGGQPWKAFAINKAKRILTPMLFWNACYILFFSVLLGWAVFSWKSVWYFFTGFIHLWYLFVLLQFFVLHKLLMPWISRFGAGKIASASAFISILWYALSSYMLIQTGDDHHWFEWYLGKSFVGWSIFYFFGVYLAAKPALLEWIKRNILLLSIITSASYMLSYINLTQEVKMYGNYVRHYFLISSLPFQITAPALIFALCAAWEKKSGLLFNTVSKLGKDTFGIYLIHLMFIMLAMRIWLSNGLERSPLSAAIISIIVWTLSLLSVRIFRFLRIPLLGG